jgi:hypothetical protein
MNVGGAAGIKIYSQVTRLPPGMSGRAFICRSRIWTKAHLFLKRKTWLCSILFFHLKVSAHPSLVARRGNFTKFHAKAGGHTLCGEFKIKFLF